MTFKKIMLLASMAVAAVAFAAPAAQAMAPQWYHGGANPITGTQALHITGNLSNTVIGGGGFITGPCEVTFEGTASNVNGMASGSITGGTISPECETNVEGCTVITTLQAFPWSLTGVTVTDTTGVEISGVQFEYHYIGGAACPVPVSTIMATGTTTTTVEANPKCLSFENHTDAMVTHAPLPTITVDTLGTICDTTLELK